MNIHNPMCPQESNSGYDDCQCELIGEVAESIALAIQRMTVFWVEGQSPEPDLSEAVRQASIRTARKAGEYLRYEDMPDE